ncbi:MAG: hypothetical protein E8D47_13220 [Nitrospira sp.]|nr:MAG: hypothetical protein E8D47_13220 [Nitrospira sp.]
MKDWKQEKPVANQRAEAPFVNDPALLRLVKVKVLKSFRVGGKPLTVGDEVSIEWHLAKDLNALGKCAIVD